MELAFLAWKRPRLHFVISHSAGEAFEVDFAWPELKLCIELDGCAFHADRVAFARDRARDRVLSGLGLRVLRFTWAEMIERRDATIREISMHVSRRRRGSEQATGAEEEL